jgi:hypothetical protein
MPEPNHHIIFDHPAPLAESSAVLSCHDTSFTGDESIMPRWVSRQEGPNVTSCSGTSPLGSTQGALH